MPEVMGFKKFAGARLLEVGCGMGTDLLQFARGGAKVTGIDLTPRSIAISRRHFEIYGQRGDFAISDCEKLPFTSESFDVVYSNGVLHHTPDTEGAVRELHRVLRHGLLGGELWRGRSPEQIMSRYVEVNEGGGCPLVKVYSRREVRKLFSSFRDVSVEVEQLTRPELPVLGRFIPESILRFLRQTVGGNVIVSARK